MIKELRRKFTIVAMASMFAVLLIIMIIFQIVSYIYMAENADHMTAVIAENDGAFPPPFFEEEGKERPKPKARPSQNNRGQDGEKQGDNGKDGPSKMSPETPYETRYFSVSYDNEGKVSSTELEKIAAVSEEGAVKYAEKVKNGEKRKGFTDTYRYRKAETKNGCVVVFLDCHSEIESFWNNFLIMSCVSAVGLLAVFILVVNISGIVFRPVAQSYQKQKQFITDASHELKTPLTIIDANAEVIEMENGESAWTKSIRNQVRRLSALTQQMVTLSHLDEENSNIKREQISLSEVVKESIEPFETLAETNGKQLVSTIEKDVFILGMQKNICHLLGILLDNAIKYSVPGSTIEVSLMKKGKKAYLEVCNQAEGLQKGNLDILFERFYTMEHSRNSEISGSGIGLSIARAVVISHKGKITAYSADGKSIVVAAEFKLANVSPALGKGGTIVGNEE